MLPYFFIAFIIKSRTWKYVCVADCCINQECPTSVSGHTEAYAECRVRIWTPLVKQTDLVQIKISALVKPARV